ncbi:MAG: hypothetical protein ABFC96_04155, partial [Thermoguttaceae bacterium]
NSGPHCVRVACVVRKSLLLGEFVKPQDCSSPQRQSAANSGAVADVGVLAAELARIVAVWPMLPAVIRRAMLALVECNR